MSKLILSILLFIIPFLLIIGISKIILFFKERRH